MVLHPVSCTYKNITFAPWYRMLPQEPHSIQLANLQWHAGPVQVRWRTAPRSEEDCLPPGLQPDDLWLWHCTAGAQWAVGVHQHYPTHLPTRFHPRLPCRHVVLGHRLGRAPRRRYNAGIDDYMWNCSHSLLFTVTDYHIHFEYFSNWWPTLQMFFSFAYPTHIKIKTSHSAPIPLTISYSSLSFIFFLCLLPSSSPSSHSHFVLPSCFPLMSLPFLYLPHHDILLLCSTLPPFSLIFF